MTDIKYVKQIFEETGFINWELLQNNWNELQSINDDSSNLKLKKAINILLYDQYEPDSLHYTNSDETFVDEIISVLIATNYEICPFKNYSCIEKCKHHDSDCIVGRNINCKLSHESIWEDFIYA